MKIVRLISMIIFGGVCMFGAPRSSNSILVINRMVISDNGVINLKEWSSKEFQPIESNWENLTEVLAHGDKRIRLDHDSLLAMSERMKSHDYGSHIKMISAHKIKLNEGELVVKNHTINKIFNATKWGQYVLALVETAEGVKDIFKKAGYSESYSIMIIDTLSKEVAIRDMGSLQPQIWIVE